MTMKLFGQGGLIDFTVDEETLTELEYNHLERTGQLKMALESAIEEYPDDTEYPVILAAYQEEWAEQEVRPWWKVW